MGLPPLISWGWLPEVESWHLFQSRLDSSLPVAENGQFGHLGVHGLPVIVGERRVGAHRVQVQGDPQPSELCVLRGCHMLS